MITITFNSDKNLYEAHDDWYNVSAEGFFRREAFDNLEIEIKAMQESMARELVRISEELGLYDTE